MIPGQQVGSFAELLIAARVSGVAQRAPDRQPRQAAISGRLQLFPHSSQESCLQVKEALPKHKGFAECLYLG